MTQEQLLNILENDPRCKLSGKSIVVTFYESPFDDVVYDVEAGTMTFTIDGESVVLDMTDDVFENVDPVFLECGLGNKKISLHIYFGERDVIVAPFDPEQTAQISGTAFEPFHAADDGGDDGGDGE